LKARVLINFEEGVLHEDAINMLSDVADLVFKPSTEEEFKNELSSADALLLDLKPITAELVSIAERLKIIARYGVGYDNVDVEACSKRGIYVTITPNVLSDAVADLTLAMMLALARNLLKADKHTRTCWGKGVEFPLGVDLKDKKLGIIGAGRIGLQVAKRAKGFGMEILYYDVVRKREMEEDFEAKFVDLEYLLRNSDFVSIHTPLNENTRGMIGEKELNLMKPTAYLINTARGPIIDQDALIKVLKEGKIAGAGLDVYEKEPLPLDNPLTQLDNVLLTPHIGSATLETRRAMAVKAAKNIVSALKGEVPPDLVPEQAHLRSK